jgi:hypothetical protein
VIILQYILASMLAFLFLLTIIFFTTIRVTVHLIRKGKDDKVRTNIKAWFGLINIRTEVPIVRMSDDLSGTEYQMEMESPNEKLEKLTFKMKPAELLQIQHRIYQWIKKVHALHHIMKRLLKGIRLEQLEWRSSIGTGDAAQTGTLSGISWGVKSNIIGLISNYLTLRTIPRIHIEPLFQEKKLETELKCMIRFRIGYAILAGIRIVLNLRKRRDKKWQIIPFKG